MIDLLGAHNLLSFKDLSLKLGPLNVLIGPNGSGKSNVISALAFLQSTASDPIAFLRNNGGARDWIFKKKPHDEGSAISARFEGQRSRGILYFLGIEEQDRSVRIGFETISVGGQDYYRYANGERPLIKRGTTRLRPLKNANIEMPILAQRRDPELYPQITRVAETFSAIRFYRDWRLGRHAPMRLPQPADLPTDHLLEDGSNLGLVLNRISRSEARGTLLQHLRELYADVVDYDVSIEGNSVQVFLKETSGIIPATRLSDGTLRWLCLLSILLHPSPPPMVCIEEPELGLHPDLLPALSRLLIDASERTQLVVATHSDALVDALTDRPEAVIVCEKADGATTCRRLEKAKLKAWLKKYSLGALWRTGEIGGNRW